MARKLTPATPDDEMMIHMAVQKLRDARKLLRCAGAQQSAKRVRRALKSAEGAARHVRHRITRGAA